MLKIFPSFTEIFTELPDSLPDLGTPGSILSKVWFLSDSVQSLSQRSNFVGNSLRGTLAEFRLLLSNFC